MTETIATPPTEVSCPLALRRFRLKKSANPVATPRETVVVPVRRPGRQTWFRVRPGEDWKCEVKLIEDQDNRSIYVVAEELHEMLGDDAVSKTLHTCITRAGSLFLWPIKNPGDDGRQDTWSESARVAAQRAETSWTRVSANMADNLYDVRTAAGDLGEPEWPTDLDFDALFAIAFKAYCIDEPDHPVLKKLAAKV